MVETWNSLTWAPSGRDHGGLQHIKGERLPRDELLAFVADPDSTELA
jgi:hypothetical protein